MKVIPTRYKGYHFRSRLEARWAVFFDALNVDWNYEPEGFEFEDGTRYLPDFWLPDLNLWVEVKGVMPFINFNVMPQEDPAANKLVMLRDTRGAGCALVSDPMQPAMWIGFDNYGRDLFRPAHFFSHRGQGALVVEGNFSRQYSNDCSFNSAVHNGAPIYDRAFNRALTAFRSARFEFGDTPC